MDSSHARPVFPSSMLNLRAMFLYILLSMELRLLCALLNCRNRTKTWLLRYICDKIFNGKVTWADSNWFVAQFACGWRCDCKCWNCFLMGRLFKQAPLKFMFCFCSEEGSHGNDSITVHMKSESCYICSDINIKAFLSHLISFLFFSTCSQWRLWEDLFLFSFYHFINYLLMIYYYFSCIFNWFAMSRKSSSGRVKALFCFLRREQWLSLTHGPISSSALVRPLFLSRHTGCPSGTTNCFLSTDVGMSFRI